MLDIQLRPLKDKIFDPLCKSIPDAITPLHVTILAFASGLLSCLCASTSSHITLSLLFWTLNRALDCLDGALARHRNTASDLGGFLDLLGDFVIYSLIPIVVAVGAGETRSRGAFLNVTMLETSFHVNNFVLFYVAALVEKAGREGKGKERELTSLAMRPALVEGFESGVLFTGMLAFPGYIVALSVIMAVLVGVGIVQRTVWVFQALK